jgi:hypothetical protein
MSSWDDIREYTAAKVGYLNQTDLKGLGWTAASIKTFFPDPDKTAPNPYSSHADLVRLYEPQRAAHIQESPAYAAWLDSHAKRRTGARAAVATKRRQTMDMISTAVKGVVVPAWPIRDLVEAAINHWEERGAGSADITSDSLFLERITKNYVRHVLTTAYDGVCIDLFARIGREEGYHLLRAMVDSKVDDAYPDLLDDITTMQAQTLDRRSENALKQPTRMP